MHPLAVRQTVAGAGECLRTVGALVRLDARVLVSVKLQVLATFERFRTVLAGERTVRVVFFFSTFFGPATMPTDRRYRRDSGHVRDITCYLLFFSWYNFRSWPLLLLRRLT